LINPGGASQTSQQDNKADEIEACMPIGDVPFHVVPLCIIFYIVPLMRWEPLEEALDVLCGNEAKP
jgi:hypothetical protein